MILSLKARIRVRLMRIVDKHKITSVALGTHSGIHERKIRRMLSGVSIHMDIDEIDWIIECIADLTGEQITLHTLIKEFKDEDNKRRTKQKANH